MKADTVHMTFENGFVGEMISPSGKVKIGKQDNGVAPYHMLFGALGSCFYATFLSVSDKMRLSFDKAEIEVSGTKRDQSPATLEQVHMTLVVYNPSNEEKLRKAAQLGATHCSIHETVSKVANIDLEIIFK